MHIFEKSYPGFYTILLADATCGVFLGLMIVYFNKVEVYNMSSKLIDNAELVRQPEKCNKPPHCVGNWQKLFLKNREVYLCEGNTLKIKNKIVSIKFRVAYEEYRKGSFFLRTFKETEAQEAQQKAIKDIKFDYWSQFAIDRSRSPLSWFFVFLLHSMDIGWEWSVTVLLISCYVFSLQISFGGCDATNWRFHRSNQRSQESSSTWTTDRAFTWYCESRSGYFVHSKGPTVSEQGSLQKKKKKKKLTWWCA